MLVYFLLCLIYKLYQYMYFLLCLVYKLYQYLYVSVFPIVSNLQALPIPVC